MERTPRAYCSSTARRVAGGRPSTEKHAASVLRGCLGRRAHTRHETTGRTPAGAVSAPTLSARMCCSLRRASSARTRRRSSCGQPLGPRETQLDIHFASLTCILSHHGRCGACGHAQPHRRGSQCPTENGDIPSRIVFSAYVVSAHRCRGRLAACAWRAARRVTNTPRPAPRQGRAHTGGGGRPQQQPRNTHLSRRSLRSRPARRRSPRTSRTG